MLPDCCLMQMPVRLCGNVSLCVVLLQFWKSALCQRCQHQSAICLNAVHVNTTYKADYLWLESHLVLSQWTLQQPYCPLWHCWPSMYQTWGLYAGLCCNESRIPTTNVLNYDFVSYCLMGWASNNTEEEISQLGHSPAPMLPFQITDGPHIKGSQRLSLWSKQTTNKHMKQPITGVYAPMRGAYF